MIAGILTWIKSNVVASIVIGTVVVGGAVATPTIIIPAIQEKGNVLENIVNKTKETITGEKEATLESITKECEALDAYLTDVKYDEDGKIKGYHRMGREVATICYYFNEKMMLPSECPKCNWTEKYRVDANGNIQCTGEPRFEVGPDQEYIIPENWWDY